MSADVKALIRAKALELGFSDVGFARAQGLAQWKADLDAYLAEGRHGTMDWMAETAARRADPQILWPEARSVIVLGTNYAPAGDALKLTRMPERGNISVYARNRDYHDLLKRRLKALGRWMAETWDCQLKVFVDTAPVMEKPLAAQTALGWRGRHTNIVSRRFGSWLFLGEVFTTLEIAPDLPEADHCGSCRACVDACPTQALDGEGRIDARRCISYLTIESKAPVPEDLRPGLGNRLYGCDDCMAACPWNKFAPPTTERDFLPRVELTAPKLADLVLLDEEGFREVFTASPVKRAGYERFMAGVLMAIANGGQVGLLNEAERRQNDLSPLIRDAARWAVLLLRGQDPGKL
ncbi:Epoxyqueuosine (oQ) reductase QueG [Paramagnetospirillum magnetotacticum MS-1]|uniref:Epoxyqueuosine reductase n=1 Tax=Paramagnetospirillum magnetotacticum MS-1 TaxID=272627 RepID=A0A0C2V296_PARME|nr:tRNA epoxyqueuosine(34) reductase QueG [Paramagnetospirillum magnetotacticum]KIL99186.1 Epoxyqueuosine (oQ) reductase QueG [Paramagnetospirillum magnetotacticum MS-1]